MAEKEQQSAYPANGYARSVDTEAAAAHHDATREQRKKKRTKCILYILLFIVFQTAIITVFALTVMKVKTPKFRIRQVTFTSFNAATDSLQATMNPEFTVKNTNFGRYKYRNTTVDFFYRGTRVAQVFVPNSKTGWRSTKKFVHSAVQFTDHTHSSPSPFPLGSYPLSQAADFQAPGENPRLKVMGSAVVERFAQIRCHNRVESPLHIPSHKEVKFWNLGFAEVGVAA